MLGDWAHEGPQPPSNLEERKGLKEAQHAAHSHPPDPRGDLRLARGHPSRPSTAPRISASLEGSEPTLEQGESSPPRSRPPFDVRDKRPFHSPARRTEALNANHSSTAPRTDGVRPPFPTVAVTGVPSANSGHCSAIPDAVAALWNLRRRTRRTRHSSHYYSANSGCPDSTSPRVWPRTRPLLEKGSGVATCPPKRDAQH